MTQCLGIRAAREHGYRGGIIDRQAIQQSWDDLLRDTLDESGRQLFAAAEVRAAGYGALAFVSEVTGLARSTINRGEDDLDAAPLAKGRVRRSGGGRIALCNRDKALVDALRGLVEPATLGDPMRPLTWVSKTLHNLAAELSAVGHPINHKTVRSELVMLGFSRQGNHKADEGSKHPDRNAQFAHINAKVIAAQVVGQPVVSVNTKKKELVGNYRTAARTIGRRVTRAV